MLTVGEIKKLESTYGTVNPAGQDGRCLYNFTEQTLLVDDDYDDTSSGFYVIEDADFDEIINVLPEETAVSIMGMNYDVFIREDGGEILLDEECPDGYMPLEEYADAEADKIRADVETAIHKGTAALRAIGWADSRIADTLGLDFDSWFS